MKGTTMTLTLRNSILWLSTAIALQLGSAPTPVGPQHLGAAEDSAPPQASAAAEDVGPLLVRAQTYRFGENREALSLIEERVFPAASSGKNREELAAALARALEGEATADCKQFVCRQLAIIGSASAVPALVRLLADEVLCEPARGALQVIPGPEAEAALLQALSTENGSLRIGIIASLGARRAKAAIDPLTALLNDAQSEIADAAANALGAIGGADAARVLKRGLNLADSPLRARISRAAVACADGLVKDGNREEAGALYEALYKNGEPDAARVAAFLGMVRTNPDDGLDLLLTNLKGSDPALQAAALRLVREVQGPPITAAVCGVFGDLAPPQQALLLRALADRRAPRGIAAAEPGLKSPDVEVRIAALQLVAVLGNEEFLDKLAELAATTTGAEQAAAREALARLPGREVDDRIAAQISTTKPSNMRAELARSLGRRGARNQVPQLLSAAKASDAVVRIAAIQSLGDVAALKDMPVLLRLLSRCEEASEQKELENTLISTARRSDDVNVRSELVILALGATPDSRIKASLLMVLSRLCGPKSLQAVTDALKAPEPEVRTAAIRSLSEWEHPEAIDLLLQLARTWSDPDERSLTLRGHIRLLARLADQTDEERLSRYKLALDLATRDDELKPALLALGGVRLTEALQLVVSYLDRPGVQEEAATAAVQIARRSDIHPEETRAAMQKVLAVSKVETTRRGAEYVMSPEARTQRAIRRGLQRPAPEKKR
jgi:HEAT repeat protein